MNFKFQEENKEQYNHEFHEEEIKLEREIDDNESN